MTPADFGIYSVFVSYESIIWLFCGLCLHSSIKAANVEFPGEIDKYTSSMLLLTFVSSSCILLCCLIVSPKLCSLIKFSLPLLVLCILQGVSSAIFAVYNNRVSLDYNYALYLKLATFSTIGNVAISLFLMLTLFRNTPYLGRILGTVIPVCILAIYIAIKQFALAKPKYDKRYWKFGFWYSLPIIPHGASQVILAQFSRIMIQNMVGNLETGLYSFAFTVAIIPQTIATSLDTAWSPWFFERYRDKEFNVIKHRANQYVALFSAFTIALCALSPEIIKIMAPKSYWQSIQIVIPAILGVYFTFMYYLPAGIEYYMKKTWYIALGTVCSGVLNIVSTYYIVKHYGYVYVAYGTAFIYFLNYLFHCAIAKHIAGKLPYNMKFLALNIIIVFVLSVLITASLDFPLVRALILVVILLFYAFYIRIQTCKNKITRTMEGKNV